MYLLIFVNHALLPLFIIRVILVVAIFFFCLLDGFILCLLFLCFHFLIFLNIHYELLRCLCDIFFRVVGLVISILSFGKGLIATDSLLFTFLSCIFSNTCARSRLILWFDLSQGFRKRLLFIFIVLISLQLFTDSLYEKI